MDSHDCVLAAFKSAENKCHVGELSMEMYLLTWICVCWAQIKEFGWKVYKAVRNRTDAMQRFFPGAFKNFFYHRDAGGALLPSGAACQLLGSFGVKEGKQQKKT